MRQTTRKNHLSATVCYAADKNEDPTIYTIDFSPVESKERRPWDPDWYLYSSVAGRFVDRSQRLLNLCCGNGVSALRFARLGYQVDAFETTTQEMVTARSLAKKYSLEQTCNFQYNPGNRLDYPDSTFDLVVGFNALCKLQREAAVCDVHRVLKPGGVALFKESIAMPHMQDQQDPGLTVAPQLLASLNAHYENQGQLQLTGEDLRLIHNRFRKVETMRFTIFNRLNRLFANRHNHMRARIRDTDEQLLDICPPLAKLANSAVLICYK